MPFTAMIAICCDYTNTKNTRLGQNADFLNFKAGFACTSRLALKD
jgi:hypothetical protein